MDQLQLVDYLFLYCIASIWLLLLMNIILTVSGYLYHQDIEHNKIEVLKVQKEFPKVTILIPAHNEEKVIEKTLLAMLKLNYPSERLEIIIINDDSKDHTLDIIEELIKKYPQRNIKVITNRHETGGKGKSNALNIGYKQAIGEYIVVYDADNTPNSMSLRYLVYTISQNNQLGAVIGKFRTRNKMRNLLTKFINIETLSFQWMAQAGRWKLFRLCTIPGTNFIIRKNVLEQLGGWDVRAIAEDTEISFRIYSLGYRIAFMPLAVTWEQEPETIKVWIKQRTRWVNGNIYVLTKFIKKAIVGRNRQVLFDLYYFFSVYFLFLSSIITSHIIFILGMFTDIKINISGNYMIIWLLTYLIFVFQVSIALSLEKGEASVKNIGLIMLMYFTYCQLWLVASIKGMYEFIKNKILHRETKWYKTERF